MLNLDHVLSAYLECALWASHDEDGRPLDDRHDISDLAPEALDKARADVRMFVATNAADCEAFVTAIDGGDEQVGHDLFLTRNRHGAGFWDRDAGAVGERLSAMARAMGEAEVYRGDDGKVYFI